MIERAASLEDVLDGAPPLSVSVVRYATEDEATEIRIRWRRSCSCGASWWWIQHGDRCPMREEALHRKG